MSALTHSPRGGGGHTAGAGVRRRSPPGVARSQTVKVHRQHRRALADVVVKLSDDPGALAFLRTEEPGADQLQLGLTSAQRHLGLTASPRLNEQSPPINAAWTRSTPVVSGMMSGAAGTSTALPATRETSSWLINRTAPCSVRRGASTAPGRILRPSRRARCSPTVKSTGSTDSGRRC